MRISLRPGSLFGIFAAGYVLIIVPVAAVAVLSAVYARGLVDDSNRLLDSGIRVIQRSQSLEDNLIAMDRAARQYGVLGDATLITAFAQREKAVDAELSSLKTSPQYKNAGWQLDRIQSDAQVLSVALERHDPDAPELAAALAQFEEVHALAQDITTEARTLVARESSAIEQRARDYENLLIKIGAISVPVSAALMFLLIFYAIWPLRKISQSIRDLGAGRAIQPIQINGPQELRRLGEELDWLRERLATVEGDKNRFLRQVSHDLKTPLASVREGVELLADGVLGELSESQGEVLAILRKNSFELQTLVENLLDFEEWREKASRLDRTYFPLRALIDRCVQRYRVMLTAREIKVKINCMEFQVHADRERLRMVLDNLISNALKFSPQSGTVTIRARLQAVRSEAQTKSSELIVEVADEGPGISPADREKIFDAFFTGHPPSSKHLPGTGIGLAVVYDCVKAHGGAISVVDHPARGACLRVRLPMFGEHAAIPAPSRV
ncbi:MAG: ATP-binding protein [Stenotrophobium sp.]